jgi:3-oxoadipate enol-lactonase
MIARAGEADLYYQVDGTGPDTVVLVNGVGDPLDGWASQLDEFLAAGLDAFHLAGVSMGGVIAQEYALAHPRTLRSQVLANTFAAADPFTRAAFQTWSQVAEAAACR